MPNPQPPAPNTQFPIWLKLTAAFLLVIAAGIAIVAFLADQATATSFSHFLAQDQAERTAALQAQLADLYARQQNWQGAEALLQAESPGQGQGMMRGGTALWLADASGRVIAAGGGRRGQRPDTVSPDSGLPITVNGQRVGTLVVDEAGSMAVMMGGMAAQQFLAEVNRALTWAALVAVALAVGLGLVLSRNLTRPLRQLTQATRALAGGRLEEKVTVNSHDEVGELAHSFNQMAEALAESRRQREQMLADIAHELRTPLSIMRGHLEGMLDNIFPTTPENLTILHEEILLLTRLVEELRTLSLADAGQLPLNRTAVDLREAVNQAAAAFAPLAEAEGIELLIDLPPLDRPGSALLIVRADPARLQQVIGNLLANAFRHTAATVAAVSQPTVSLRLAGPTAAGGARVSVSDNGPGLAAEALPHVFDRFWRADTARSRDQGGSGLGLAICKGIVEAHGGRIWADSAPGNGATFTFELPAAAP